MMTIVMQSKVQSSLYKVEVLGQPAERLATVENWIAR
jgi:hypothetical protein